MADAPHAARGGSFEFHFGSSRQDPSPARRPGSEAMRMLVIGDFSGRSSRMEAEAGNQVAAREVHEVDVDTFDGVMGRVGAAVLDPLAAPEDALPIEFRSLDDFHPDRLVRRVEAFGKLRRVRERLRSAGTFEDGVRELVALVGFDPAPAGGVAAPAAQTGGNVFASLLGGEAAQVELPRSAGGAVDIDAFVRSLVQPHVVKSTGGREAVYLAVLDAAMSGLMRRLMHAPAFKALEAAWRSVHRLVTTLETGERLVVHLLDVTREEIIGDLATAARAGGLVRSGLYAQLVEGVGLRSTGERWGMVLGLHTYERTVPDAVLLTGMAQLASAAGAPYLAGAGPSMVGCRSFADGADPESWQFGHDQAAFAGGKAWEMLRVSEESRFAALGMPRMLLRVPYGAGGEETESFSFEELPDPEAGMNASEDRARHESYLWASGGVALAEVLGGLFLTEGWSMDPGGAENVEGLPVHSFNEGRDGTGPKRVMPCAEAWVTERGAHVMRQSGVTPVMSIKGHDAARVAGVASLHASGESLGGRWR